MWWAIALLAISVVAFVIAAGCDSENASVGFIIIAIFGTAVGSVVLYQSGKGEITNLRGLSSAPIYKVVGEANASNTRHVTIVENGAGDVYAVWTVSQPTTKYVRIGVAENKVVFEPVDDQASETPTPEEKPAQ